MADDKILVSVDDVVDSLKDLSEHLSDEPPGPFVSSPKEAYETAVEVFRSTIPSEIRGLSVEITPPDDWVNELIAEWREKVEALEAELAALGGGQSPIGPSTSPPIDPILPLERIALAINAAEKNLNKENLIISSGSIEVNLNVDVGGVAGASANIKFTIAPQPYQ
jgi:hypothetical protein